MHGKDGSHLRIAVPLGTEVWINRDVGKELVADLIEDGESVLMTLGGMGGNGNKRFASAINRVPLLAEEGELGEEVRVDLELKLLADVALLGLPNAGKSSLLASSSASRPRIADYPFTTVEPLVGVVEHGYDTLAVVDMPAVAEGASQGHGLGNGFLRHAERARLLVYVLDGVSEDAAGELRLLRQELRHYDEWLLGKKEVVVVTKLDLPEVASRRAEMKKALAGEGVAPLFVSTANEEGLEALWERVSVQVKASRRENPRQGEEVVPVIRPRPRRQGIKVWREDERFVVSYPRAERIIAMLDENDWGARVQLLTALERMGVGRALREQGIQAGDGVRFGRFEMEWQ